MIERDVAPTKVSPPPTPADIAKLKEQIATLTAQIADLKPSGDLGGHTGPVQKPGPGLSGLVRQLGQLKAQLAAMLQPRDLIRAAIA